MFTHIYIYIHNTYTYKYTYIWNDTVLFSIHLNMHINRRDFKHTSHLNTQVLLLKTY